MQKFCPSSHPSLYEVWHVHLFSQYIFTEHLLLPDSGNIVVNKTNYDTTFTELAYLEWQMVNKYTNKYLMYQMAKSIKMKKSVKDSKVSGI